MKQKIKIIFTCLLFGVFSFLASCNKQENINDSINTPLIDSSAPVIDFEDEIQIDFTTETFNLYNDVIVTDINEKGENEDLTSSLDVKLPIGTSIEENNNIKFTKPGDYVFEYHVEDKSGNQTVKKRLVKVRNIYNCYWVNATIPVLYCALDIMTNNYKSLLVFTRKDTLNIDVLNNERFIYKVNGADVPELETAKKYVSRIAVLDEWSYFRLFLCDTFNQIELFSFTQYGIPESRYEVKLVSDGSLTYNTAFPYRENDSYDLWEKNLDIYNNIRKEAFLGNYKYQKDISGFPMYTLAYKNFSAGSHYYADAQLSQMSLMASQRDNVELWCAYPETLKSKDKYVQLEIEKSHTIKKAPDQMFASLSEEQKVSFLKLVNFDKDNFDKLWFHKEGDYLIITGANPVTGPLSEDEFIKVLTNIISDYKNYNILFKPHPSAIPSEQQSTKIYKFLKDNNIDILPGKLPMEIISWVYPKVKIGGFDSSLFMSIPQGNTVFFIAENEGSLSALTHHLYNGGAFGNPKFYWK